MAQNALVLEFLALVKGRVMFFLKVKRIINLLILVFSNVVYSKDDFLSCGRKVFVHDGVRIDNPEHLSIGDEVYIGPDSKIFSLGGVYIGCGVVIGEHVQIMSSNHEYDSHLQDMLPFSKKNILKETVIGDYSWIGNGSIILPGVRLGKYCVVGAGSVVTKSTEDFGVYGGNPARLLKYRDNLEIVKVKSAWVASKNQNSIYFLK